MTTILIGSTIPAFKAAEDETQWGAWLFGAAAIAQGARDAGHDVEWIATLQQDARGDEPFRPLLRTAGLTVYRYSLDLGHERISSDNRLAGICIGRNLIIEHALNQPDVEWIYFADSDIEAPPDVLPRLLELGARGFKVIGAHVPSYCLGGDAPKLPATPGNTRVHWNTAGSLMVHRDVFTRVPWRWNPDRGETDDPATQAEMRRLGYETVVRHDVLCRHHPEHVVPLEARGHDLEVHR